MSFSFDATAGASQSTSKPRLAGNDIYTVQFDGCEIQDIQGVKDPGTVYKVLKFKFSNENGTYEHTIFEPKGDDFKRGETEFTNKNGNKEKIPQPSNVESMMLFFKHLIDAFVPEVAKQIDEGTKKIQAPSWDELRVLLTKIMKVGEKRTSKIKLIKKTNGDASFPGFFAGLTKPDAVTGLSRAYIRNNFVGEKVAFTPYELTKITNESSAKITNMGSKKADINLNDSEANGPDDLDLSFEVELL